MNSIKKAKTALISVFHKDGLGPIVQQLNKLGITIYSTGGTESFIKELGIDVVPVEDLTSVSIYFRRKSKNITSKSFWWNFSKTRE